VLPSTDATPAGSPTNPANTRLFDPVTEVLPPLLNKDRVVMELVDFATNSEPSRNLPWLQSPVPPEPVFFIAPRRSARLRVQRDSDEAHQALFCQDGRSRQQLEFLSMSAAIAAVEVDPDQYQDVMTSENESEWIDATKREFHSLTKNIS
jgi:hypothetical protein